MSATYTILSNILVSRLTPHAEKIIGDYQCGFYATDKLLIIYSAFIEYRVFNLKVDR
jgi:hypothetical protein